MKPHSGDHVRQPNTTLTDREREVFAKQQAGMSRKEIARELELSLSTVDNYLTRAREKRRDQVLLACVRPRAGALP